MSSEGKSPPPAGRLHQQYYRNGQSHRDGADVSFQDIRRLFGFQSITVGRWVTAAEQQIAANLFFDALYDLIDILQINERVVSLNGSLSLAFGTGGQKHANAHYHPAKRQLALAKNAGGGALAHEWFHAFDHYISQRFLSAPKYSSQTRLKTEFLYHTAAFKYRGRLKIEETRHTTCDLGL